VTNQEHELEGPSGFVPLIAIWNIAIWPDFGKWRVQNKVLATCEGFPPSPPSASPFFPLLLARFGFGFQISSI
jgi:hypothetical protein